MRRLSSAILASVSLAALTASPAFAQGVAGTPESTLPEQEAQDVPAVPEEGALPNAEGETGTIVVTGSRIPRDNFKTPSPVVVITRDDAILAGVRSTAEVLQSSTITSGTAQINGSFLGFVSEGGPAANTVGLRGLGSNRTLVLLNGRRLAPAGAGPQLISADLNVLPSAMVQRIEVLREGASSVYGSDAIAGVINVITDTRIDGLTLDFYTNQPIEHGGGGRTYRASVTWGKVFERGHITGSLEYRQLSGLRVEDRDDFTCPRDLFFQNGVEVGQGSPGDPSKVRCFPFQYDGIGIANAYGIAQSFTQPLRRYTYGNIDDPAAVPVNVNNINSRPLASPTQLKDHVISPIKNYTAYVNGSYEIEALGDAEVYGEALFTRRKSHQDFATQFSVNTQVLSPDIQIWGGDYYGTPISVYGYPVSPFFPTGLADIGYNIFTPFIVPDKPAFQEQRVDFFRANGGLRGNMGLGDWTYDGNIQVSKTRSRYNTLGITTTRLNNALITAPAPAGTPAGNVVVAVPGQANAGQPFTCASNLDSGGNFIAGSSCVPFNIYDPDIFIHGHIPSNVFNYLYQDNVGHTDFDQTTFSLNVGGTVVELPGGPVRLALGAEHRLDSIDDRPSDAAQDGTLYNFSSGGRTKGKDRLWEAYGEVDIPILKEKPFIYSLEFDGSLRYTHYKSYGTGWTYHLNAQWAPIEAIRFRGNYGTSFRAPNLYEQFVADQTGFFGAGADPCDDFTSSSAPGEALYDNCLAVLTPILGTAGALAYVSTQGPEVTTRGGAGNLKAEHSKSYGFGTVITVPKHIADLSLAVDYWHIRVKDEVTTLGTLILSRCYDATDFPDNQYCDLIAPRAPASDPHPGALTSFLNPYLNVSLQQVAGIDFDARYAVDIGSGKFLAQLQATRNLKQEYALFAEDTPFDYNGTLGTQGFAGGPKWVGALDLRYTLANDITFRWGVTYVGRQSSENIVEPFTIGGQPVDVDLVAETYIENGASVQWKWRNIGQVTLGVSNIFNVKPPTISGYPTTDGQYFRTGNYFNTSNYDFIGRSIFMEVTRSF